ncbi:MAG: MarR family transcriptional regulator [Microbacterium sp.]|nr:MAG: MarR family transcriptional regulator [Microbacterium sp.]
MTAAVPIDTRTAPVDSRLNQAVCFALYSAMNATVQLYRDLLAPWGLTYQQLMVLGVLWQETEATPTRIGDALMLDSSTVAGLLKRLEAADLVHREPDPDDRRRVRVLPSEQSRAIASELGWLEACLADAIDLTPTQAGDLISRLHTLRESVIRFPRPAAASPGAPHG